MATEKDTKGSLTRRLFLGGASAAAALTTLNPFEALALAGERRPGRGYGPLVEAIDRTTGLPLIKLPEGFSYVSFGWRGDLMRDGVATPGGHDGGAIFEGARGLLYYVRNHELSYNASGAQRSFAPAAATYDAGNAPGGTSTVVFDGRRGRYVESFASLSGTVRNCAGGPTPWNTWLTCEENLSQPDRPPTGAVLEQTHGWVFEVPANGLGNPAPIRGLGRFNHEAVAVDPETGFVFETEDTGTSGVYRFLPKYDCDLHAGGALQMLRIKDWPQLDTGTGEIPVGTIFDVDWVPIADPEAANATNTGGVFAQGFEQGGAIFRRGEGIWYGRYQHRSAIYIVSTSGGAAGEGQVFELDPRCDKLRLVYESPSEDVLDNPDNIALSPRGGIILCEDGDRDGLFLRGLNARGEIFDFAQNNIVLNGERNGISGDFRGSEWAGACFSQDGRWLFVSIQSPGVTFAITGPWQRGGL